MKKNHWFAVGVMVAWLTCSMAHGQQSAKSIYPPPPAIPTNGDVTPPPAPYEPPLAGLSDFILYRRANCCDGQPGSAAPLFTEIYVRSGRSIPIGGQTLGRELDQGWSIAGGARALFFDPGLTSAWTVDLHVMNIANGNSGLGTRFPLSVVNGTRNAAGNPTALQVGVNGVPGAQVDRCNRTMVGAGLGREWYIWRAADSPNCFWRVGADGGGRYGAEDLGLIGLRHQTDTVGGTYAAVHSDLEVPTHAGIFFTGIRLEWAYTWSDVLQRPSDIQELNIMLNVGLRF